MCRNEYLFIAYLLFSRKTMLVLAHIRDMLTLAAPTLMVEIQVLNEVCVNCTDLYKYSIY